MVDGNKYAENDDDDDEPPENDICRAEEEKKHMYFWRAGVCSNLKRCRPQNSQNYPQHHHNYWTPLNLQIERSPTRPQTSPKKKVKFSDLPFNRSKTPYQSPKDMVDRWTYGSRIKSLHPSRYTSEGGAANLPLFPPGARNLRPSVDPPRSPPTTSPVVPTPGNPPKVTPQVSPPGTSDVPPKCVPHNIPRGIFHLPPREAVKSEAGEENGVKYLARPPITSEATVKLEGILKTTPKYQGLPKADPEAQRIDSARNPQF